MSLTPRGLLLVGLILLAGAVGQWAGPQWSALWRYPAAVLVGLILIEGLVARGRALVVEWRIGDGGRGAPHTRPKGLPKVPLGEPVAVTTRIENPSARRLLLESEPRYPAPVTADVHLTRWSLAPGQTLRKREAVTLTRLGPHALGQLHLRLLGPWGLAWWTRRPLAGHGLTVVPRALTRAGSGIGTSGRGDKPVVRAGAAGRELLAQRDYQPGDPPRTIDWKATARARKPIVRVFAEERRMDLALVLDAGRGSRLQAGPLTRLGHYVNVAARLAELALAQGDRVALVSFAGERLGTVPLVGGMAGLRRIRDHLERLQSSPQEYNPLAAVLYLRSLLPLRSLVVFLTEVADAEAAGQLFDAIRLLVPKHSPLVASLLDEPIEALRTREPHHWLDPYRSFAAMEYGQARDNSLLQLRHLGAEVILAPPERLDPALLGRYQELRLRHRV